jgi:hypothetical protein
MNLCYLKSSSKQVIFNMQFQDIPLLFYVEVLLLQIKNGIRNYRGRQKRESSW